MEDVARGDNLQSKSDLADSTIREYVAGAVSWIEAECPGVEKIPLYISEKGTRKAEDFHPYLRERLSQRAIWRQPREKKEPISGAMFDAMHAMANQCRRHSAYGNYGRDAVLWDFVRLACYTGSRLGEYGLGARAKGCPLDGWNKIPDSHDVPAEWRGRPLAFIAEDFVLYDRNWREVSRREARRHPKLVQYVEVRFRYDKSPKNFSYRRFKRMNSYFCIVDAVLSILRRHHDDPLRRHGEPLGFLINENGTRHAISGKHMQQYLQDACVIAHPDPEHYLRKHIHCLMSHCCRVTAAVALYNAGVSIEDIAWRLRWSAQSVQEYLRDCMRTIEVLSLKAMAGAYILRPSQSV